MKNVQQSPRLLQEYEDQLGGVFTQRDLANLMGLSPGSTLQARIVRLVESGYLSRAKRGFYHTHTAKLEALAIRMFPQGYFSLGTAMSYRGLIGTRPQKVVDLLVPGERSGELKTDLGRIRVHVHQEAYHFGFSYENDLPMALPEKAWIDCCYFHLRGVALPFHLQADVAWQNLDLKRVREILGRYQNPRFIRFVENTLEAC